MPQNYHLIDSHVHLDMPEFDGDRDDVIRRSTEAGVDEWIIPATTPESARRMLDAPWRTKKMHLAVGIHPHHVSSARIEDIDLTGAIAIGECGLDYHYGGDTRDLQIEVFERQVELAERHRLPLIIHCRDAYADLLDILSRSKAQGVLHCFTGDQAAADRAVGMGLCFGLGGVITFNASEPLREVVRNIPKDRILVETDAPYLAPVPKRGKRNEPCFLPHTLQTLSALFCADITELSLLITSNSKTLFNLPT